MKAVVSLQISPKRKSLDAARLERFAQRALQAVKLTRGGIGVLITGSDQLQQLNRRFRGKNKPTDVLSFPPLSDLPVVFAGDIAISAEIAAQNAKRLGHSRGEEVKVLILHGVLHLAGFDHLEDLLPRLEVLPRLLERGEPLQVEAPLFRLGRVAFEAVRLEERLGNGGVLALRVGGWLLSGSPTGDHERQQAQPHDDKTKPRRPGGEWKFR